jgi:hypothetical protein
MNFKKLVQRILYADLVICALTFMNGGYNLFRFYSVPEIDRLIMGDSGIASSRAYINRRDLVTQVLDVEQRIQAKNHLDNLDLSNAVLGISGLAAIGLSVALVGLDEKK